MSSAHMPQNLPTLQQLGAEHKQTSPQREGVWQRLRQWVRVQSAKLQDPDARTALLKEALLVVAAQMPIGRLDHYMEKGLEDYERQKEEDARSQLEAELAAALREELGHPAPDQIPEMELSEEALFYDRATARYMDSVVTWARREGLEFLPAEMEEMHFFHPERRKELMATRLQNAAICDCPWCAREHEKTHGAEAKRFGPGRSLPHGLVVGDDGFECVDCGRKGDIADYVMLRNGYSETQALTYIAARREATRAIKSLMSRRGQDVFDRIHTPETLRLAPIIRRTEVARRMGYMSQNPVPEPIDKLHPTASLARRVKERIETLKANPEEPQERPTKRRRS